MINNISNNTISGSIKEISQDYSCLSLTPHQTYFMLTGIFITLIVLIICIKETVVEISDRACIGCKRLRKCENEIKELKRQNNIRGVFDNKTFKHILSELEKIKEWFSNNGKDNIK